MIQFLLPPQNKFVKVEGVFYMVRHVLAEFFTKRRASGGEKGTCWKKSKPSTS